VLLAAPRPAPAQAAQPRRHALVIGITVYQFYTEGPRLMAAATDAQRFAALLGTPALGPFDTVTTLFDQQATKAGVEAALAALRQSVSSNDLVFVYFSGHGTVDDETADAYLVPYDAAESQTKHDVFAIRGLVQQLRTQLGTARVVLFLDACFSGVLFAEGPSTVWNADASNVILFASSRDDEPSWELPEFGGLFTAYVIEGLKGAADVAANRDGVVTSLELSSYVQSSVSQAARQYRFVSQLPIAYGAELATPLSRYTSYVSSLPQFPVRSDREWLDELILRFNGYSAFEPDHVSIPPLSVPRWTELARAIAHYANASQSNLTFQGHVGRFCFTEDELAAPRTPAERCGHQSDHYLYEFTERMAGSVRSFFEAVGLQRGRAQIQGFGAERPVTSLPAKPTSAFDVNKVARMNTQVILSVNPPGF
jgi:hypothetical protein